MRRLAPFALLAASAVAGAQIVLKPSGEDAIRLDPRTLDVQTDLRGGVARTLWTYTFANAERFRGQADFLLKIPKGGVVEGFAYWYNGEKVVARITEKTRAARIYKAIVDRQRDPALVEMVGKDTFRVRIFPIQPDADLKVEVSVVQALSAKPDGATLTLPLHTLGKLERATVKVKGDGKLLTSWGGMTYAAANTKVPDLRITQPWAPQALHASLHAARSGGPGGFFVLTLTPSKPLRNRKWRLSGPVEGVIEVPTADGSTLLVGRYRKPGTFYAVQGGHTLTLTLPDTVEPNGPATKLWAWNRILQAKDRKEIVLLSLRHGVPSRYTSWIAIPTEERKRMAREIAQAELRHEVETVAPRLARVGPNSREGKRIAADLQRRARARGVDLDEVWNVGLSAAAEARGQAWVRVVAAHGEESPAARRIMADVEAYRRLGVGSSTIRGLSWNLAQSLAPLVLEDRLHERNDVAAKSRAARFRTAVRRSVGRPGDEARQGQGFLETEANSELYTLAERVVRAERAGKEATEDRRRVVALSRAVGIDPEKSLRSARMQIAQASLGRIEHALETELDKDSIDETELRRIGSARKRELANLKEPWFASSGASLILRPLDVFRSRLAEGKADPSEGPTVEARIRHLSEITGIPVEVDLPKTYGFALQTATVDLGIAQLDARRDQARITRLEETIARLKPVAELSSWFGYSSYRNEPNQELRDAYVTARHQGLTAGVELARLVAAMMEEAKADYLSADGRKYRRDHANLRRDVLRTDTELDQLDRQTADPQVLARKAELEKRSKELRARMGDPILRVEAPGAKAVVAKLPDGSWLALHSAGEDVWEGRFDVPPGAADGRYLIPVYADGVLKTTVPITVDTVAPKIEASWKGDRVEVTTDKDVRRVAGFTPNGERVELVPEAPGRFAALVPPGTRFVATDGAHNRSDQKDVSGMKGLWTPGVTGLARVNGRLWVGTANDGGAFSEEKSDPARPWIKSAVRVGKRLAVREADGTVTLDGVRVRTSRTSTAIAADGDRLLVGTIGGFYDGDRPVFPPALAGVVVTALLADEHTVWLGTQGRGLAEIDRRTGALKWHDERNGLGDDWITCLGWDERGRLVAGTFVAGAYVCEGRWSRVPGTAGTCVSGVDGPWVATRSGTFRSGIRVDSTEATTLLVEGNDVLIGTRSGVRRIVP